MKEVTIIIPFHKEEKKKTGLRDHSVEMWNQDLNLGLLNSRELSTFYYPTRLTRPFVLQKSIVHTLKIL